MDKDHASTFCGENLCPKVTVAWLGRLVFVPINASDTLPPTRHQCCRSDASIFPVPSAIATIQIIFIKCIIHAIATAIPCTSCPSDLELGGSTLEALFGPDFGNYRVIALAIGLAAASVIDIERRSIPNYLTGTLFTVGLCVNADHDRWTGLYGSALGTVVALAIVWLFIAIGGLEGATSNSLRPSGR